LQISNFSEYKKGNKFRSKLGGASAFQKIHTRHTTHTQLGAKKNLVGGENVFSFYNEKRESDERGAPAPLTSDWKLMANAKESLARGTTLLAATVLPLPLSFSLA
jgi:hypothetical protein